MSALRRGLAMIAVSVTVLAAAPRADAAPPDPCLSAPVDGQKLRKAGKLLEARDRFAFCGRDTCPAAVVQACTRWAHEVDSTIPTVVVSIRDEQGKDVLSARVSIDGAPPEKVGARVIELNPGEHRFVFERSGSAKIEQTVLIHEGEKNRSVSATFAAPPKPLVAQAPTRPEVVTPESGRSWWTPMRTVGAVVVGAGVASALTGFALAFVAKSNWDGSRAKCQAVDDCPADAVRSSDSARELATGATVAIVAGAGVAAVGGALIVLSPAPSNGQPAAKDARRAALSLAIGAQSVGVVGRW